MGFQGTTESLFQRAEEMDIQRETQLANLLITYEHQLEADGQTPDADLLRQAEALLRERLQEMPVDQELAHIGVLLYRDLGQWEDLCSLLSKYRERSLPPSEEAWARWTINDCLALAQKHEESVEQQLTLFHWARQQFPLEQCLFVFNDATQAACWGEIGQRDRWFALFEEIMSNISFTA